MLHQSLLEGLAPTANRCMRVLSARCWILHCCLFVNRHVKENGPVAADPLLESRVNPTVHVMAWICWAIERGVDHCS